MNASLHTPAGFPADGRPLLQDPGYAALKQYLIEATGLAYYADKDNDLAYRIGARLAHLELGGCGAYLDLLRNGAGGAAERHLLIADLTIGETFFFRHTEQFDALRDLVLPDLIERNRASRTLRIWSAGCSIGAEPYTVAILLKQHFADRIAGWDIRILGTDINQSFLARAERGQFEEWALRSLPEEFKREWFTPSGRSWILNPSAREWVSFQYHNLVEHPYPSLAHGIAALDLILCRNVMIYFDWNVIRKILGQFYNCLADGGWLAVGHAESNPEIFRAYQTVNVPGATMYRRNGKETEAPRLPAASTFQAPWVPLDPSFGKSTADPITPIRIPSPSPLPGGEDSFSLPALQKPALPPEPLPIAPELQGLDLVRRLADEGQWAEAAQGCERLIEENRLNPRVHFCHAMILEQTGRHADAERAHRRAIYLDRNAVMAHYHLALLLKKSGNGEGARQSFNNVRALLARMDRDQQIPDADGVTVEELSGLAEMQLSLLRK